MSQINKACAKRPKPLIHVPTQNLMKTLISEFMFPYLDQQAQMTSLVLVQSLVRRHLALKRFATLKQRYIGTPLGIRLDIFRALVRGEREFMAVLDRINRIYLRPLRIESKKKHGMLSPRDHKALFSTLPLLTKRYKFSFAMLKDLRDARWPAITGIGEHFERIRGIYDLVVEHASNIQFVLDTHDRLSANPKFAEFEKRALLINPGLGHFDFTTLLRFPLSHIPTFHMRLQLLLEHTPDMPDFEKERAGLSGAIACLKGVNKLIADAESNSTVRARLLNVAHQLETEPEFIESLQLTSDPHRQYVREGNVVVFEGKKKSERLLFMLNDMLLLAKGESPHLHLSANDVLCINKDLVLSEQVDLENDLGIRQGKTSTEIHAFKLIRNRSTAPSQASARASTLGTPSATPASSTQVQPEAASLVIVTPSAGERQIWIGKIRRQLELNNQVFGVPLAALLAADSACTTEDGIPAIVQLCTTQLKERALRIEGLFRISPNKHALKLLTQLFNRGLITTDEQMTSFDPNTIAEILKVYFRSLPEPLMTFPLSEELARQDESVPLDIPAILARLPAENRRVLDALMAFLNQVCAYSKFNRMTPGNVAIVFGPNLIREQVESFESSMRMPRILAAVEALVNHYQLLEPLPQVEDEEEPPAPTAKATMIAELFWPQLESSEDESEHADLLDDKQPATAPLRTPRPDKPDSRAAPSAFPGVRVRTGSPPRSPVPSAKKPSSKVEAKSTKEAAGAGAAFPGIKMNVDISSFDEWTPQQKESFRQKLSRTTSLSFRKKGRPGLEDVFQ